MPRWRNGRRGGLKIRFPEGSVGSSPSLGKARIIIAVALREPLRFEKLLFSTKFPFCLAPLMKISASSSQCYVLHALHRM